MASLTSVHERLVEIVRDLDLKLSPKQTAKLLPILEPALRSLNSISLEGCDQAVQGKIISVLSELDTKLQSNASFSKKKVEKIHQTILSIKKELLSHKIDLTIAYFSTTGCKDYNGAFIPRLDYMVSEQIPFVASRSLLSGAERSFNIVQKDRRIMEFKRPLLDENEWEVFAHPEGNDGGELVICIPKKIFSGDTSPNRLARLDLKTDGSLKQITIREAFSGPVGKHSYHDFADMFTDSPIKSKMFLLFGHGGVGKPAGMEDEDYHQFLQLCNTQLCRGLITTSCYSGGKSTLIPIQLSKEEERSLSFPIVAESLGDWPTTVEDVYVQPGRTEKMRELFEHPGQLTVKNFQKTLEEIEKGKKKLLQNSMQVTFPHSYRAPGGSRPPVELERSQSITIADMRREQFLQSKWGARNPTDGDRMHVGHSIGEHRIADETIKESGGIKITDKKYLLLHPTEIPLTITHKAFDPVYISMVPGKGQHYIENVKLNSDGALLWIDEFKDSYEGKLSLGEEKGFFIGKLESGQAAEGVESQPREVLEGVVFKYGPGGFQCIYKKEGAYFLHEKEGERPISSFLYALLALDISNATAISENSSQAVTAGQQDRNTFLDHVKGFWQTAYPELEKLPHLSEGELEVLFDHFSEVSDKIDFIFCVINLKDHSKTHFIIKLLEKEDLSPNAVNSRGQPLLSSAIVSGNVPLVEYLLNNHADIRAQHRLTGYTPLDVAVSCRNINLVRILLNHCETNPLISNPVKGSTSLSHAGFNIEIARTLLGAGTEEQREEMWSKNAGKKLLSKFVIYDNTEMVELFLENGANPNLGKPLPLFIAIWNNNLAMAKLLMEHGANIFAKKNSGITVFTDCVKYGTLEMVLLFLKEMPKDTDPKEISEAVFLSAIERGNTKIIDALIAHGIGFPVDIPQKKLNNVIERFEKVGDYDYINKIFQLMPTADVSNLRAETLLQINIPSLTYRLIQEGVIDPEKDIGIKTPSPLHWAIRRNDIGLTRSLIRSGHDPASKDDANRIPLFEGIKSGKPEMIKLLLDQYHESPDGVSDGQSLLEVALTRKDPQIVRIMLSKGIRFGKNIPYTKLEAMLALYVNTGEYSLVSSIFELIPSEAVKVELLTVIDDPGLIRYLVEKGQIDLNAPVDVVDLQDEENVKVNVRQIVSVDSSESENPFSVTIRPNLASTSSSRPKTTLFTKIIEGTTSGFDSDVKDEYINLAIWGIDRGGEITDQMFINEKNRTTPNLEILKIMVQRAKLELVQEYLPVVLAANDLTIASIALTRGVDLNKASLEGKYPIEELVFSAKGQKMEIIEWAIEHGMDVNLHNKDNFHPLTKAIGGNASEEFLNFLMEKGAVLTSQNDMNYAQGFAYRRANPNIMRMLNEKGYAAEVDFWKDKISYLAQAYERVGFKAVEYGVQRLGIEVFEIPVPMQAKIYFKNDFNTLKYLIEKGKQPFDLTWLKNQVKEDLHPELFRLVVS